VEPSAETETLRQQVQERTHSEVDVVRDRTRIAVLPLVNISSDPEDEYFADGMTEELIYTLSQIRELKIIAQTSALSYKNTKKTVAQIGRELSIGTVIEGSVRKADETVRVTIQLIDVSSEEHIWAQKYDRPFRDVFSIQSDIAQRVAAALRVQLLDAEVERMEEKPTVNLEAYMLYLKGRYFLRTLGVEDLGKAIECFEQALGVDPEYALAYSGLADAHCLMWFVGSVPDESLSCAKEAADRAVGLDRELAEGYASQALVKWVGEKDLDEAERLFKRAITFGPKNATVHRWHGRLLNQQGRKGEALVEVLKAHEIDPLSSMISLELGDVYRGMGRDDDAIKQIEEALELNPRHLGARVRLAYHKMRSWDWGEAEAELLKVIEMDPTSPFPYLGYARLLLILGRQEESDTMIERALALAGTSPSGPILCAVGDYYFRVGGPDRAVRFFEQAIVVEPQQRHAHWWLAICYSTLGRHEEAIEALGRAEERFDGFYKTSRASMSVWMEFVRGLIHLDAGDRDKAVESLARLQAMPEDLGERANIIAILLFRLGEIDAGFEWLEKSVNRRDNHVIQIGTMSLSDEVRNDSRYVAILKRMGLPV